METNSKIWLEIEKNTKDIKGTKSLISKESDKMENSIIVKNLTKRFKTKVKEEGLIGSLKSIIKPNIKEIVAVDNISLKIKKGEIVAFIGPNGAGKSTTIKILTGILYPSSGEATVEDFVPWKKRTELAYRIGSVFGQKPQLWYHLPAIDTFNLFSKIYDLNEKEYRKRLNYLVDLFEIRDIINTPVRKLSLGQRMKCEIVASLLHKPKVLLLDEPTIGLDIIAKQKIRELIINLNKKEKVTILLTSHDIQDIERLCKRIVIINHGKIVYDGNKEQLNEKYLSNKIVSVKFEGKFNGINVRGVKLLKAEEFSADFEVDTSKISIKGFVDHLIKNYEVLDINISSTPIEEIIAKIYNRK